MPIVGVQEFFRDSVARALRRQRLEVEVRTAFYVVSRLALFSRSEAPFERPPGIHAARSASGVAARVPPARREVLYQVTAMTCLAATHAPMPCTYGRAE